MLEYSIYIGAIVTLVAGLYCWLWWTMTRPVRASVARLVESLQTHTGWQLAGSGIERAGLRIDCLHFAVRMFREGGGQSLLISDDWSFSEQEHVRQAAKAVQRKLQENWDREEHTTAGIALVSWLRKL